MHDITLDDLLELHDNGLYVDIKNKPKSREYQTIAGMYFGDLNLIELYKQNIPSQDEFHITLLHELYHAHFELKNMIEETQDEDYVESCAQQTYALNEDIAHYAQQIWDLKYWR